MRPRYLFLFGIGLACYMGWKEVKKLLQWKRRNLDSLERDIFADPMDWGEHPV